MHKAMRKNMNGDGWLERRNGGGACVRVRVQARGEKSCTPFEPKSCTPFEPAQKAVHRLNLKVIDNEPVKQHTVRITHQLEDAMTEQKKLGRPSNGKPIILRIPATEETRNALETAAKAQCRSMAAYAGAVIEKALGTVSTTPQDEKAPARQKAGDGTTVLLTISLQPELKTAVKAIAKVERRTASNMACLMLRDWIEKWEVNHPGVNVWGNGEEE